MKARILLFVLLIVSLFCGISFAAEQPIRPGDIILNSHTSKTWIDSRSFSNFKTAIESLSLAEKTIWVTEDTTVSSDFAVGTYDDLTIVVKRGATLTLNDSFSTFDPDLVVENGGLIGGNATVSFTGVIEAGPWQVFGTDLSPDLSSCDNEMAQSAWWGLPDATNSTSKFQSMEASDAGIYYMNKGTYAFGSMDYSLTNNDAVFIGPEDRGAILDGDGTTILRTKQSGSSNLVFKNLKFTDWSHALAPEGDIGSLVLENNEYDNCRYMVRIETDGSYEDVSVNDVKIKDNWFHGFSGAYDCQAVCLGGYKNKEVWIQDNTIEDLSSSTGWLSGITIGQDEWDDANATQVYTITGNVIRDLNCTQASTTEIHGIYAFGREITIENNVVRDILAPNYTNDQTGHEGIYTKARYSHISGNSLLNAGTKEGMIAIKGRSRSESGTDYRHPGYQNVVTGNSLVFEPGYSTNDLAMMAIEAQETIVADNTFENQEDDLEYVIFSGVNRDKNNYLIQGNIFYGVASGGIYLGGQPVQNYVIKDNSFYGGDWACSNFLHLRPDSGASSNIVVADNVFQEGGISGSYKVIKLYGTNYSNVDISRNTFELSDDAVHVRVEDTAGSDTLSDIVIRHNVMDPNAAQFIELASVSTGVDVQAFGNRGFITQSWTSGSAGCTNGTTAGYARTTNKVLVSAAKYDTSNRKDWVGSTDDYWDLTGVSTLSGEYKMVLLCKDTNFGNALIIEGPVAGDQFDCPAPNRPFYAAVLGFVIIEPSYSGGDLSGFDFFDVDGAWQD